MACQLSDCQAAIEEFLQYVKFFFKSAIAEQVGLLDLDTCNLGEREIETYLKQALRIIESRSDILLEKYAFLMERHFKCLPDKSSPDYSSMVAWKASACNCLADAGVEIEEDALREELTAALAVDSENASLESELAECIWRQGEVELALKHFEKAVQLGNGEALWKLSMASRHLLNLKGAATKITLEQSLNEAKCAVKRCPTSDRAWECLGNAFLTAAVPIGEPHNQSLCKNALAAYSTAVRKGLDSGVFFDPSFHNNRGMAFQFIMQYENAIKEWFVASMLDPLWTTPRKKAADLCQLLETIQQRLRPSKTLSSRKKPLARYNTAKIISAFHNQTQKHILPPKLKTFKELQIGLNTNCILVGKVVISRLESSENELALNVILVDSNDETFHLRVAGVGRDKGPCAGDIIAIPEPQLTHVFVSEKILSAFWHLNYALTKERDGEARSDTGRSTAAVDITSVCIPSARKLVVNSRALGKQWDAPALIQNIFYS